jgi:methanethiol oxidase
MKPPSLILAVLGLLLGAPGVSSADDRDDEHRARHHPHHERFLNAATIAQSNQAPDFISVIGGDPRHHDFGRIVNRIDTPNVGDNLHHFGYLVDQRRLIVPGLFSNRMHIFSIHGNGRARSSRP